MKQYYYGKFHFFHRKIKGVWKICMWYDDDDGTVVDGKDFEMGVSR